ncbi:MAG: hypothetical protein H7Y37_14805 [Anaerolineae bacterium]|nr:hypothetical protein [Gloeobacterales cyanobacterium ES-bin-313]
MQSIAKPIEATVVGLFNDRASADKAIAELRTNGFDDNVIDEFVSKHTQSFSESGGFMGALGRFFGAEPSTETTPTSAEMTNIYDRLTVLGLDADDAREFQSRIEMGGTLVMLQAGKRGADAIEIMKRNGASPAQIEARSAPSIKVSTAPASTPSDHIDATSHDDASDSNLATAHILAKESSTPLVLNEERDNLPFVKAGVKFRQIMAQRGKENKNVRENVLAVVDSRTLLVMERGEEGFFVLNKALEQYDITALDLTLTNLEGCYRELHNNFSVTIERNSEGKKFVTRWGTASRGGMQVEGLDALYFIREPFSVCVPG